MKSLSKVDLDAKTQPLDKLYIKLTNHTLMFVAKCPNLLDVTSLHSGVQISIGKCYYVIVVFTDVDVKMPKRTEQRHNAIQTGANQGGVAQHMGVCKTIINRIYSLKNKSGYGRT